MLRLSPQRRLSQDHRCVALLRARRKPRRPSEARAIDRRQSQFWDFGRHEHQCQVAIDLFVARETDQCAQWSVAIADGQEEPEALKIEWTEGQSYRTALIPIALTKDNAVAEAAVLAAPAQARLLVGAKREPAADQRFALNLHAEMRGDGAFEGMQASRGEGEQPSELEQGAIGQPVKPSLQSGRSQPEQREQRLRQLAALGTAAAEGGSVPLPHPVE